MQAAEKIMFQQTSGNPFEEESLPKAYYFPSLEKHLSSREKKTCLSPSKEKIHSEETSHADAKFLRESNKLSSNEIPTREDGTVQHEPSSGSQFDESWPSTDRNVSSLSPNTPPSSSSTSAVREKENQHAKASSKDFHEEKFIPRQSTLSKYIDRFRHGAPTSREDRTSSGKDFWWLSPPSNTSTPKEPYDSTTSKFSLSSDNSSKIRRNATSTSPPCQKYGIKRNQFSRPVRETVEIIDSDATNLLTRTNQLLAKSDNTSSEVSSESIPKRPSSWMIEKHKRLDNIAESKTPVVKARLAPEDDILYQWRLARRLEKAQAEAKDSHVKHFANTATHHAATSTWCRYNAYLPEQDHPRYQIDSGYRNFDLKNVDNTSSKRLARTSDRILPADKIMHRPTDDGSWKDKVGVSAMHEKETVYCKERTQETRSDQVVPLERNVPAVCFIDEEKVPSHVHMMCDIVPCSKQMDLGPKKCEIDVKKRYPGVSDVRKDTFEPVQQPDAECHSFDIWEECSLPERNTRGDRDSAEGTAYRPRSADKQKEKSETDTRNHKDLNGKKKIIPNSKQQPVAGGSNSIWRKTTAESDRYDQNELQREEKPYVENSGRPGEPVKVLDTDKLSETAEGSGSSIKPVRSVESNDLTNLVNTSASVSRISHQSDQSSNELTDMQNSGVIGTVIGQVISERLFSSMSTSRRSSASSNSSVSIECGDVANKKGRSMVLTSKECENRGEQELTTAMHDDILFPDDDILIRLRQQANLYKGHLRNIDRILQQLTESETSGQITTNS